MESPFLNGEIKSSKTPNEWKAIVIFILDTCISLKKKR